MISSLLGKKIGMTQVYDAQNVLVPVTVVEAGPCSVVQVKTVANDGYNAVQLGFSVQKTKNASKAELSHAKAAGLDRRPAGAGRGAPDRGGRRSRSATSSPSTSFAEGQFVDVIGVSKGKGFQGVVRRFRVAGGPAAHGSMFHRRIGSIGMRQTPGRSWKNQSHARAHGLRAPHDAEPAGREDHRREEPHPRQGRDSRARTATT